MIDRGVLEAGGRRCLFVVGQLRAVLCEAKPLFCAAPGVALLSVVAPHQTSEMPGSWGQWMLMARDVGLGM